MAAVPIGCPGRKLRKRMAANRGLLLMLMTDRDLWYTRNISEPHLRPPSAFHKVTNGLRCERVAETYAACRFLVSAAQQPERLN